ncbi:peroxiredoxin family protein [Brevibacillus borstelensis]|uniref:TlpA family protein disulfide reductase n=1 Tax=Brevibacillus borstelensis TaxID=45462 RepID=UPI00203DB106|nr:redoxin domain-containing protein [Brevibacillus borstelensis]MCM3561169.1 peroxiredoxin family protein [Brevibacillus borstelensis]
MNSLAISNVLLWVVVFVQSIILLFFIRLVVQFLNRFRISDKQVEMASLSIGGSAPFFREKNQQGDIVELNDQQAEQTLLLFTNDHCGTCKAVISELQHARNQYPHVRIIVVANPIYYEKGMEIPEGIHLIRSEEIMQKYQIHIVPTAILVDENRMIRDIKQVKDYRDIESMFNMPVVKVG